MALSTISLGKDPLILRLDIAGRPLRWIPWQTAVVLMSREMVAWSAGERSFTFRGGINRLTGHRSKITVSSIVAVKGKDRDGEGERLTPPLSNRELFLRDDHLCMYCGNEFPAQLLTRDHLIPLSQGGKDCWINVVAACRACNHAKGARAPDQAGMKLLAIPYTPNRAEYLVLSNRRILADQMSFLKKRFRRAGRSGRIG